MKGEIDEKGNLYITRKSTNKIQCCPYQKYKAYPQNTHTMYCGDHCPKFGEPYEANSMNDGTQGWVLLLCTRDQLFFTELTDNRK